MSDFEGKIRRFDEDELDRLHGHKPYHCYFTEDFTDALHQPLLHITGIIHDPALIPEMSAEMRLKELGGLEHFSRTTFVYGASTDPPVSYDNAKTGYIRSSKEGQIAIARPRVLSARELLDREVGRDSNSLLEVYIDTGPFHEKQQTHLDAEGAKRLILNGIVRSMMGMPRPSPKPITPLPVRRFTPGWRKAEKRAHIDPRMARREEQVGLFVAKYGNAIELELGVSPEAITLPGHLSPKDMRKWQQQYAPEAELVPIDESDSEGERPEA